MKKGVAWFGMFLMAGFIILGCSPRAKYEKQVRKGLSSGIRHDSLFMGMYFGMPSRDFYSHCWILNQRGMIKQGTNNMTVEYEMKDELKHPATMNYYPEFVDDRIVEMPVRFTYNGWAPWNKELSSVKLEEDVLHWFEQTYGPGFIKVEHPKRGTAWVKVDGNRRITIFREDELHVWAVFTDLSTSKFRDETIFETDSIDQKFPKELEK